MSQILFEPWECRSSSEASSSLPGVPFPPSSSHFLYVMSSSMYCLGKGYTEDKKWSNMNLHTELGQMNSTGEKWTRNPRCVWAELSRKIMILGVQAGLLPITTIQSTSGDLISVKVA